jgi:uncharacterized membrane protein
MQNKLKSLLVLLAEGFFIVLPVLLVVFVFKKLYDTLKTVILKLVDVLPGKVFQEPMMRVLAVVVAIIMLLVLLGLLTHTRLGRAIGRWLEGAFLRRLPLYSLLRNFAKGLAGKEDEHALKTVLVTVKPGVQQFGLLVEHHADGSGTVFLPSSPNPSSGTVQIVEASLIRELHVPAHMLFKCLSRWGDGTTTVLAMTHDMEGKDGQKEEKASD